MWDRVPPEAHAARASDCFVRERLVPQPSGAAHRLGPGIEETVERACEQRGDDRDAAGATLLAERPDSVGQRRERLFPLNRCKSALPRRQVHHLAAARASNPIRVVETLESSLASNTEATAIDGMIGIPFDLDRPSFSRSYMHAAAGWTLSTDGRVPGRDAGHLVFRRHDVGNDPFGWKVRTGAGDRRGCRSTEQLQKRSPTDAFDQ